MISLLISFQNDKYFAISFRSLSIYDHPIICLLFLGLFDHRLISFSRSASTRLFMITKRSEKARHLERRQINKLDRNFLTLKGDMYLETRAFLFSCQLNKKSQHRTWSLRSNSTFWLFVEEHSALIDSSQISLVNCLHCAMSPPS